MKPLRILIVDDHAVNLRLLRAQLEGEGHTVIEASNGEDALVFLRRENIEAIISDILMPVMDGYRLCHEVRSDARFRDLPFIIYTASYVSPSDEKLSLDLGADRYLRKPANLAELVRALEEAVRSPGRSPVAKSLKAKDVLKEYSERLVEKLEEKNVELGKAVHELALHNMALESAAHAMIITDVQGIILWINPAFTTMTGYAADEAIGKTPRILKSGLHNAEFYGDLWDTILSGRVWRGEIANRRKDGTIYYDEHTVTPVRDSEGTITHFIGVMNDITNRKLAEKQLREAHGQLRGFLDHTPAVLYALSVEGDTISPRFVTENVTRLLGFQVSETLSYDWWRHQLHPEDRDLAEASIAETMTAGVSRSEYRIRHKDGTYRWVDDNRRLVRDEARRTAELIGVWNDITDRKRAQEELRESDRRFRDMLNNLELVAMMLDLEGNITYCNDYFQRLTGYSREEVIGCNWIELFIPPDQAGDLREAFASLLLDRPELWHHRNEIVTRSGTRRLIQWNNSILRSASGDAISTASVGEDITDRARAERELQRSEEHLRIVVSASTDAVWERDVETGEIWWSDRGYEILGYTRETFQPNLATMREIVHPDDILTFSQAIKHHLHDDSPLQVRVRMRHRNGSYIAVLARGQLQRDTGRIVGVFTDLSVVEHAEEQIREQAALIEQTHEAIAVRDFDDRITFWNSGAERLYGWTSDEVLGRRFGEVLHVDQATYRVAESAVLLNGAWNGQIEKTTATGKTVIVDGSWTLLRNDDGSPKAIFSIDTDITERKVLEKQFYRAQRLESLGTLASGIAHDLNNLLMPILMGATLLKRLNPEERSLLAINNIERSVKRGTDLVRQVLLFARGTEGVPAPVRMDKVVDEVQSIVGSTFPKNIAIVTNVPKGLGSITGDSTQLNQVFMNLLVNARDAMPEGGTVTISATEIDVGEEGVIDGGPPAGHYIKVDVVDTGSGMPPDVMDRIFEPFFTTKDLSKGTGLGLSTVQGIMRGHGGLITVSSEIGRGTAFHLYLPAGTERTSLSPEVEAPPPKHGRGEVILVVDDESAILAIMRQTLEAFGYSVVTAEDGAQGFTNYARDRAKIAVVVTDMMMPVMDGAALIEAIRRIDRDVPIIAVTGQPEGQIDRAAAVGATESIAKPFSAELLLRTVSDVLHRRAGGH